MLQNQLEYDWNQWQSLESEEPYGYSLFLELLEEASDDSIYMRYSSLKDSLPLVNDSMTYFFMNYEFNGNEEEVEYLIEFVSMGNQAFLCIDNIYPFEEILGLNYQFTVREYYDSSLTVNMNFYPENLHFDSGFNYQFLHADTPTIGYWNYFDMDTYEDSMVVYDRAETVGTIENAVNFASFPIGKGKIHFHLQQRMFSNIYLKEEYGYEYLNRAISILPERPIYFDRYNQEYREDEEYINEDHRDSPLTFLFENPPLRYAWYTLLAGILLFLLFRTKRQQRIIPILPSVDNTSIEFARALGTLYYQSNSPKYLGIEMMNLFHTFNRRRYNVQPGKKGETNEKLLARKSKVPEADIANIYKLERRIRYNDMARMNEVVPLFNALKSYYKNAK